MRNRCSEFEELMSAALDGELETTERTSLQTHVDNCPPCRHLFQQLQHVNQCLIACDQAAHRTNSSHPLYRIESPLPPKPVNGQAATRTFSVEPKSVVDGSHLAATGRRYLAGGLLAVTAAGLAALLSTRTPEPPQENFPVTDISAPIEKVTRLNQQALAIQASQVRTMEQELRTLRLMARSAPGDDSRIAEIESRIDDLIRDVQQLEQSDLNP
jgi:hypothetical protein